MGPFRRPQSCVNLRFTMRTRRPSPLQATLSPMLTVAPALAAFGAALGLGQIGPSVQAATNPPPPVIKPLPMLSGTKAYPDNYRIERTMKFKGPIPFGDWAWNETNAPLKGPVLITVDINSETLSVFRGGHQIGMTRMTYGDDDKPTPIGVFPITQKSEKHRSNIFVNAPMPYMLRMTNDGISVHGADKIKPIYATNGCIGIPNTFAKKLFGVVELGDRIVVTKARDLKAGDIVATAAPEKPRQKA
jgi:lipoprotein-anchoring transpeptidase ErfK/SrfK